MKTVVVLAMLFHVLASGSAVAGTPTPVIVHPHEMDRDFNLIADTLDDSLAVLRAEGKSESLIRVIVTLYVPPSREDTGALRRMGGTVTYTYRHAIYGFAGSLPASSIPQLAASLGGRLCIIELDPEGKMMLDDSARHIRARPLVWDVANGYGLDGDPGIVIGIIDTGFDESHPDLAGKTVFWHDFSDTELPSPDDLHGHGTAVTSIASGTGEAIGSGPFSEVTLTGGWLFPPSTGTLDPCPLKILCLGSGEVTVDLAWTGTGTACMDLSDPNWNMMGQVSGSTSPLVHTWTIAEPGYHNLWVGKAGGFVSGDYYVFLATYPAEPLGDGHNLFQGIAPECRLAGAKVTQGSSTFLYASVGIAALDSFSVVNDQYDIKVTNCSWAASGALYALRAAATGLVTAGTVVTCCARNDYPSGYLGDPGLAPAVITVGAINDFGEMTFYSSMGPPGWNKPDVVAPGGSFSYTQNVGTGIECAESNRDDIAGLAPGLPDRQPDDYNLKATGCSWSSPHVAGLAALVIEAFEQTGLVWSYTTQEVFLVKSIILMTATETNKPRQENLGGDPTLDRGGKDRVEGYGKINADAAVEAVLNLWGERSDTSTTITFGDDPFDRKCWATRLAVPTDSVRDFRLYTAPTLDADLYIYTPDFVDGDPDIVASSTGAGEGISEFITGFTSGGSDYYLVAKHVSGDGDAELIMGGAPTLALSGNLGVGELELTWAACPWASAYWVYGADNEAYFEPGLILPFQHRLAVLAAGTTTWSSAAGIGDADHNWTYLVIAADASGQELARSDRVGEFDLSTDIE